MQLGFVGLGIMGTAMARNLLSAGHPVAVWNRTVSKSEALREEGAEVMPDLHTLAASSNFIILMLDDTPAVEEVLFSEGGLADAVRRGSTVVDMSTISPNATEEFARKLRSRGCELLDAPVSGGDVGARNATLTIMAGGERKAFESSLAILEILGKKIVYCGKSGNGQRVKLINQILCGLHAVALAEAFATAHAMGLDVAMVHEVVSSGAAASWALDNYGTRILEGDFKPGFRLEHQFKDLRIAQETLDAMGVKMDGVALSFDLFQRAVEAGHGERGSHALYKLYEREKRTL